MSGRSAPVENFTARVVLGSLIGAAVWMALLVAPPNRSLPAFEGSALHIADFSEASSAVAEPPSAARPLP